MMNCCYKLAWVEGNAVSMYEPFPPPHPPPKFPFVEEKLLGILWTKYCDKME